MASTANEDYLLGHVSAAQENPRLDTQHQRITHGIMKGRLVHESIPIDKVDGPIADICCGTGVWLNDLSKFLCSSEAHNQSALEFIGFDSNPMALRNANELASNVRLVQHDCVEPFDPPHIGKFGLVNMRGLAFAIPKEQLSILLRNAVSLLKPGGYLQWLDTESNLWKSEPWSHDFYRATAFVLMERRDRGLVPYMPNYMVNEILSIYGDSDRLRLSLLHFGLTPGGAGRADSAHETILNNAFSDTVSETLELLLQGYLIRGQGTSPQEEIADIERLKSFIANARGTKDLLIYGSFPLLTAQLLE